MIFSILLTGTALGQESWPASSDWVYLIDIEWESTYDPQDQSQDYKDIIADADGHDAYFYATETTLFFRMGLRGGPLNNQGTSLLQFSWHAMLDADGDNIPDWDIVVDGIAEELYTEYNTGSAEDPDTQHPTFVVEDPLGSYVRVTTAPFGSLSDFTYLDFQVPFSALQVTGYSPNVTFDTPMAISMATSSSTSVSNASDFVGGTSTVSGAMSNSATLGGSSFGFLYDSRDTAPYSTGGNWSASETVLVSGYGWPVSTAAVFNGGNLAVRIVNSSSTIVWTGTVTTDNSGELSSASTWTIPGGTPAGEYRFQVESPIESGTYNAYDSFTVLSSTSPSIGITKSVSSSTVQVGSTVDYTISIENSGSGSGTITTVRDTLPTGFSYVASSSTGLTTDDPSINGQVLTWTGSWGINASATQTLTFTATTSSSVGTFSNIASTEGSDFSEVSTGTTAPVTTTPLPPSIGITKSVSSSTVQVGSTVDYTISIANTGSGTGTITTVRDTLPAGFSYVASSSTGLTTSEPSINGQVLSWAGSWDISATATQTLTFSATVSGNVGTFSNIATVDGSDFDAVSTGPTAPVTTQTAATPSMSITKTVDQASVIAGSTVTYTLTIENSGTATASMTAVKDTLPSGFSYLTSSSTGLTTSNPSISGQELTWTGSWDLEASNNVTLSFSATTSSSIGTFLNQAGVSGSNFSPSATGPSASVTTTPLPPSIGISKSVSSSTVQVGSTVDYTISIENTGSGAGTITTVRDTLPVGFSYVASSATGLSTAEPSINGRVLTWSGSWGINTSATQTLTFTATTSGIAGTYTNIAAVDGSDFGETSTGATASVTTTEATSPTIGITKSVNTGAVQVGSNVDYTISISNTGSGTGTITTVRDTLPTGFSYVASSATGLTTNDPAINGQVLTWSGSWGINTSSTETLTFTATTSGTVGTYTNIASVDGSDFDETSTGATASVTTTAPQFSISKSSSTDSTTANTLVTYTLIVTNQGSSAITMSSLVDTLPSGFSYQLGSASGVTNSDPLIVGQVLTWSGNWTIGPSGGSNIASLAFVVETGSTLGAYFNHAAAETDLGFKEITGASARVDLIPPPSGEPLISISKTASTDSISSGDTLSYTISVLNTGRGNGQVTTIHDDLPFGFSYVPGSSSGLTLLDPNINNQELSWNGDWVIKKGPSNILTISFEVTAGLVAGNFFNSAGVNGSDFTYESTGPTAPVRVLAPNLLLTKIVDNHQAQPGDTLTYTVTYMNIGDDGSSEVIISETVDPKTSFVQSSAEGTGMVITYSHDGGVNYDGDDSSPVTHLRFTRNTILEPAESGTIRFKVRVE